MPRMLTLLWIVVAVQIRTPLAFWFVAMLVTLPLSRWCSYVVLGAWLSLTLLGTLAALALVLLPPGHESAAPEK